MKNKRLWYWGREKRTKRGRWKFSIEVIRRPYWHYGFSISTSYLTWRFITFSFAWLTISATIQHPDYDGRSGAATHVPLTELVPGKLYKQCLGRARDFHSPSVYRTVMCIKYEQWRIYKKAVLLVLGQPEKPLVEEIIDKFQLEGWLDSFEEIPNDEPG